MDLNTLNSFPLAKKVKIDAKTLNKNQYIISLLNEGRKAGEVDNSAMFDIQFKIMDLLKELIMKYTKGESTSVTVDVTESLLNSLLYSLDFYMLAIDNPEVALKELKQKSVKKIYEDGLELLRLCVIETEKLYKKIKKDRLKVDLEAYNATIDEAIPSFFEKYTMVFEAHNTMASIDYPLVFDDMSVRGISYIKNYLEHLDIETEFCRYFLREDIKKTLIGFEKMCRLNHNIELINIFEILINNSVFSILCGNKASELSIIKEQYNRVSQKFKQGDITTIYALINKAVETVIADLQISNPLLIDYINNYKKLFVERILNALQNDCLSSLIVIEEEEKERYSFAFDEGKRMSDKNFKLTVDKIMKLSEVVDKIQVISSKVHSLQDFIDILNADCFFGEEFYPLFNILENVELTILLKLVFYEEIRDGLTDLSLILASKKNVEVVWQEYFIKFVDNFGKEKKEIIEKLLDLVDYEEIKFY